MKQCNLGAIIDKRDCGVGPSLIFTDRPSMFIPHHSPPERYPGRGRGGGGLPDTEGLNEGGQPRDASFDREGTHAREQSLRSEVWWVLLFLLSAAAAAVGHWQWQGHRQRQRPYPGVLTLYVRLQATQHWSLHHRGVRS